MKKEQFLAAIAAIAVVSKEEAARWEKKCEEMDNLYMNLQKDAMKCGKLWELNQFLYNNWDLGIYEIDKRFRRAYNVWADYGDYVDACLEDEAEMWISEEE